MAERRPRFTLTLSLQDNLSGAPPLRMAMPCDDALRISARAVEELKLGLTGSMQGAVSLMKTREMRKDLFVQIATRLGAQMAERLEDAEGWHDTGRIKPARASLGG